MMCFAQSSDSASSSAKEASAQVTKQQQLGEVDKLLKEGVVAFGRQKNAKPLNDLAIELSQPEYPPTAATVRAQGFVLVKVMIDEKGKVIAAQIEKGHPLLRAASLRSARESEFKPFLVNGQPVKIVGVIIYNFTLRAL